METSTGRWELLRVQIIFNIKACCSNQVMVLLLTILLIHLWFFKKS